MENKTKIIILAAVLAVAILAVWVVWFRSAEEVSTPAGEIGGELLEKAQNPIKDEIAEANPFKAEANPFTQDTNPFQAEVYKNPFE